MGHLNVIVARVGGNLNNNFQKSQMPEGLPRSGGGGGGGGILKLRFDRYITPTKQWNLCMGPLCLDLFYWSYSN